MERILVGFIDDERESHVDYATRLARKGIDLILYEGENNVEAIVNWVVNSEIQCLLIDHDLSRMFSQNGTDLVFEINQILIDFPCIVITNYPEQSRGENLVSSRLIWDREEMAGDIDIIVTKIINECLVYQTRKEALYQKYTDLIERKETGLLQLDEEENLMRLHSIFSIYGQTDDIPARLLSSETDKKLDTLIDHLSRLIGKEE